MNMLDPEMARAIEALKHEIELIRRDMKMRFARIDDWMARWSIGSIAVTGTLAFLIAAYTQ